MRAREGAVRDDAKSGRNALAHALWQQWDGDHIDPEGEADRLIGLLRKAGWELRRVA